MLIIERSSTHGVCNLVKKIYNIWFDDDPVKFQHENPLDKIIIFYNIKTTTTNISKIPPGWVPPQTPILGYMKILSNNNSTKLKVINCTFKVPNVLKWELRTFHQFLVEKIKLSGTKTINLVLYWDQLDGSILNKASSVRLLTNQTTLSHTFMPFDMQNYGLNGPVSPPITKPVYKAPIMSPPISKPVYKAPIMSPPITKPVYKAPIMSPPISKPVYKAPIMSPPISKPVYKAPIMSPPISKPVYKAPIMSPPITKPVYKAPIMSPLLPTRTVFIPLAKENLVVDTNNLNLDGKSLRNFCLDSEPTSLFSVGTGYIHCSC